MAQNRPDQTRLAQPIRNLGIVLLIFCFQGLAHAADIQWQKLESEYAIVEYQSLKDLQKFHYALNKSGWWCLKDLLSTQGRDSFVDEIGREVDTLIERIQEMLGIRNKPALVTIRLYPGKEELHEAYARIYKAPCQVRAWYRWRDKTVYVNVRDLHKGIMTHEITHHLLDSYFLVLVPIPIAEAVGQFVESQL